MTADLNGTTHSPVALAPKNMATTHVNRASEPRLAASVAQSALAAVLLTIAVAWPRVDVAAQTSRSSTPSATPSKPPAKSAAPAPAAPTTGEAALKQRIEQLEEQLVDMQVVIGTLESLARGGAVPSSPPSMRGQGGGADPARVEAMETQLRALTIQLERLADQVRALDGGRPAAGIPPRADAPRFAPPRVADATPPPRGGFGSTTVSPPVMDDRDAIGRIIGDGSTPPAGGPGPRMGSPPPASTGAESPKQLYEQAYQQLLQQDYGGAQTAFEEFLSRYPDDSLAGNAQYWLGESHFVRAQYRPAAQAFLKGYQTYARSQKAPDSLFKLAISLDRLGQKTDACATFGELLTKFPNAPANIKSRTLTERQRLGCT